MSDKVEINDKVKIIAKHYGYHLQKEQAIEEMAELTFAIKKLEKVKSSSIDFNMKNMNLIEEIADVSIMMMQLTELTDPVAVSKIINEKLDRQLNRIKEEEKML